MTKSWNSFACGLALMMLAVGFVNADVGAKVEEKGPVSDVADGRAIVNALIDNPTIGERLRNEDMSVGRMTRQTIQPGVEEYVLYVHTCGMCNPAIAKKGFVTIRADQRPTYSDGPVEYVVSFSIESVDFHSNG